MTMADFGTIAGSLGGATAIVGGAWKYFNHRLENELSECHQREERLSARIEALVSRVSELEAGRNELPCPDWTTSLDGRCRRVNIPFIRLLLAPIGMTREDVVGRTCEEAWGSEIANLIRELDRQALNSYSGYATSVIRLSAELPSLRVFKYVVAMSGDSEPLAMRGFAFPVDD